MIWNNLKFGKKLAISFGAILLLFATIAVVDILKTSKLINASTQLHNEYLPISTLSTQIAEIAHKAMYAQRAYRYTEDEQYLEEGMMLLDSLHNLLVDARILGRKHPNQKNFQQAALNASNALIDYRKLLAETVYLYRKLGELRQTQESLSNRIIDNAPKATANYIIKSTLQYHQYRFTGDEHYLDLALQSNKLALQKSAQSNSPLIREHLSIMRQIDKASRRVGVLGNLRRDASNKMLKDFYSISKLGMEATRQMTNNTAKSIIQSRLSMVTWFVLIFAITALLAYFITRNITKPIRSSVSFAQQIAAGNFDITIETNRTDEVGRLMDSLNSISGPTV